MYLIVPLDNGTRMIAVLLETQICKLTDGIKLRLNNLMDSIKYEEAKLALKLFKIHYITKNTFILGRFYFSFYRTKITTRFVSIILFLS